MTDFKSALIGKITDLEGQLDNLAEQKANVEARLEVLRDLLREEGESDEIIAIAAPKKSGRPKGSKNKDTTKVASLTAATQDALDEASKMEGTPPEVAAKLAKRSIASPRAKVGYGPHVKTNQNIVQTQTGASITVDDADLEDGK